MIKLILCFALISNLTNNLTYLNNNVIIENVVENEKEEEQIKIMYFYATWCSPCQKLSPVIDDIAQKYENIEIVKINIDENQDLVKLYEVKGYPTTIIFKDDEEVDRILGFMEEEKILEKL